MTTNIGLGVPISKLLPVTSTFALPLTAYFAYLSFSVIAIRMNRKVAIGDTTKKSEEDKSAIDPLQLAIRCHGNFTENVPLGLLLAAFAELNGADRRVLTGILSLFVAARVAHVEVGLKGHRSLGIGRAAGHTTTLGVLVGLAGYSAWIVRGYWGL
ncbi:MAG: hypothetical protein M1814_006698 [Vezdaea aestivalis]|nr:MAG: hypothetical protein M1814_006698 [Vezdaea aestivalis]